MEALRYAQAVFTLPTWVFLLMSVIGAFLVAEPLARRLRLSVLGTGIAIVGLGLAIAVTLIGRLPGLDLVWTSGGIGECLNRFSASWFAAEALLNLAMLSVLGFGCYLASHRVTASALVVAGTGLCLEILQAISGLGTCESGDLVRNIIGGLAGIGLGWVLLKLLGARTPAIMKPAEQKIQPS